MDSLWHQWFGTKQPLQLKGKRERGLAWEVSAGVSVPQDCIGLVLVQTQSGIKCRIATVEQPIPQQQVYARYWLAYEKTVSLQLPLSGFSGMVWQMEVQIARGPFGGVVEPAFLDWLWQCSGEIGKDNLANCIADMPLAKAWLSSYIKNERTQQNSDLYQEVRKKMGLLCTGCVQQSDKIMEAENKTNPKQAGRIKIKQYTAQKKRIEQRLFVELPQLLNTLQQISIQADMRGREDLQPAIDGLLRMTAYSGRLPENEEDNDFTNKTIYLNEIEAGLNELNKMTTEKLQIGQIDTEYCADIRKLVTLLESNIGKI